MTANHMERDNEHLRALITRMLHEADKGMPLAEFLEEATKILLDSAGGGAVVVRVEDWIPRVRCRAIRGGPTSFHFETESDQAEAGSDPRRDPPQVRICRALLRGVHDGSQACFTRRGSFWTRDARRCPPLDLGSDGIVPVNAWAEAGNFRSLVLIPFQVVGRPSGLLQMVSERPDLFDFPDVLFFEEAADLLGLALTHHRANWALRERVKELTCLYEIAQVAGRQELTVPELLQKIVALLPPGWQYPEVCAARILLDGAACRTDGFIEAERRQTAEIFAGGIARGSVEVAYTSGRPEMGDVPFLEEEEKLIREVARQIGLIVERKEQLEERSRLEAQLHHADRLATIGKLTAGVAHELNEPIGSILGFAELLETSPGLPPQASDDLGRIRRAALHSREIIKKLMLFGRQTPPGQVSVDLDALVEEGLSLLQPQLSRGEIVLHRPSAARLPRITADPRQIQQVVVNLVANAIQAMPNGGHLTVTTRADGRWVLLQVEDTGMGMSEEVLHQIFVPFFTTKDVGQGMGLGLAVVHGIVTGHGGTIQVQSAPDQGARFEVRLPVGGEKADRGEAS